jgi:hypothetical protein
VLYELSLQLKWQPPQVIFVLYGVVLVTVDPSVSFRVTSGCTAALAVNGAPKSTMAARSARPT